MTTLENDEYEIPASILQSRLEPQSGNNTMMVQIKPHNPTDVHYLYWHFIEFEKLGEGKVREFTISMYGNITLGPFTPEYLKALTVISPPLRLESGESMIWFSINATNRSTLPPILNALEFMILVNVSHETTNPDDGNYDFKFNLEFMYKIVFERHSMVQYSSVNFFLNSSLLAF